MTFSVVDVFAGAGGLSLGFKQAGFKLLAAIEANKHHAESYAANFPEVTIHQKDIADVLPESFMGVDVVIGAPPYEAFLATTAQRRADPLDRLYEDPHGELVLHFLDFVAAARPKAFLLELPPDAGEPAIMEAIAEEAEKLGLGPLQATMINAAELGVCSERHSIIISNVPLQPMPPDDLGEPVGGLLEDLPEGLKNHEKEELSGALLAKVEKMEPGDALETIPLAGTKEAIPNQMRLAPENVAPPVYGFTRFVHPFEDRLCTVREQARLMGFPDKFIFLGGRNLQYSAVGDAVPPPLARALAMEIGAAVQAMVAKTPRAR